MAAAQGEHKRDTLVLQHLGNDITTIECHLSLLL